MVFGFLGITFIEGCSKGQCCLVLPAYVKLLPGYTPISP